MNILNTKKKILIGVCAGIAIYKTCELIRLFKSKGHEVIVAMSNNATNFITPNTFQALTGNKVLFDTYAGDSYNAMEHINLTKDIDVIVIAPATANFIAKLANGICDNLLLNLLAAKENNIKVILSPSMNSRMWLNLANQRNINRLIDDGYIILEPGSGDLACGENGIGRMREPEEILNYTLELLNSKNKPLFKGKTILVTAGSTYEPIDPVRGITNISSGKMGIAIANMANTMGAKVILIHGNVNTRLPNNIYKVIYTQKAEDMYKEVHKYVNKIDIFISVAAVSDYRVKEYSSSKITKNNNDKLVLELEKNPDILSSVSNKNKPPFCVGFAAQTDNILEYARLKRKNKKLPLIVANLVKDAMNKDTNKVFLIDEKEEIELPVLTKTEVASKILFRIKELYSN